jgi:WD40 repeat protein
MNESDSDADRASTCLAADRGRSAGFLLAVWICLISFMMLNGCNSTIVAVATETLPPPESSIPPSETPTITPTPTETPEPTRSFTPTWTSIHVAGTSPSGPIVLSPENICIATEFARYVTESSNLGVYQIDWSPDGSTIAAAIGNEIRLLGSTTLEPALSIVLPGTTTSVAFSPDGSMLATGSYDGSVRLWYADTGGEIRTLYAPTNWNWHLYLYIDLAFSPDGTLLASGTSDRYIRRWELASRSLRRVLESSDEIQSIEFSPDSRTIATGGGTGNIALWDVTSGAQLRILSGHLGSISGLVFSPDGSLLASAGRDGSVKIWEVASGIELATLGTTSDVMSINISPDGALIAAGLLDGSTQVWNLAERTWLCAIIGHWHAVGTVAFSPDGSLLATGSWDGLLRLLGVRP